MILVASNGPGFLEFLRIFRLHLRLAGVIFLSPEHRVCGLFIEAEKRKVNQAT
jgi:hypothetical protein